MKLIWIELLKRFDYIWPQKRTWGILLVGFIYLFSLEGCAKKPEEKQIKKQDKNITLQIEGVVYPVNDTSIIVGETSGKIDKVYKEEGEYVHKGDLIFSIDATPLISKKKSIERKIALKKRDAYNYGRLYGQTSPRTYKNIGIMELEKVSRLYAQNYASEKELNNARRAYADAVFGYTQKAYAKTRHSIETKQDLTDLYTTRDHLSAMIENAKYRSPISGFIQKLSAVVGKTVRTNDKLGRIINLDRVVVRAGLAIGLLPFVKKGDRVKVDFVTTPPYSAWAHISSVSPVMNEDAGGAVVTLELPNKNYILQEKTGALITIYLSKQEQEYVKKYFWGRHTSWMKTVHIKSNE